MTAGPQAHGSHRAEAQAVLPDERVLEAAVFVLNRRTPKWGLGIGPLSALIASVEFLLRVGRRTGADISGKTLWAVTDDSLYIWEIPEKVLTEQVTVGNPIGVWPLGAISPRRVPDREPRDQGGSCAMAFEDDAGRVIEMKADHCSEAGLNVIWLLCGTEALKESGADPFADEHERFRNRVLKTDFSLDLIFNALFGAFILESRLGPFRIAVIVFFGLECLGAAAVLFAPMAAVNRRRLKEGLQALFYLVAFAWAVANVLVRVLA